MSKKVLLGLILILLTISFITTIIAASFTNSHNITTTFDGAVAVLAIDLDDDGDMDIIGGALNDNDVLWWENDGTPLDGGWTKRTLSAAFTGAWGVHAADLDRDGDIDILGAAYGGQKITWWEQDGSRARGSSLKGG
ncbi:FG-GAP-like repeat-containing protein [Planctomycetota bacterium]